MNKILFLLLVISTYTSLAQENPTTLAQPIVDEGKRLYRSEMASWHGTDIFLEKYKNRENIGGYLSYTAGNTATCIFFSKSETPVVIGTMTFDSTYNLNNVKTELTERPFSSTEQDLYAIRKQAMITITTDTMFRTYKNTNLNLIPIITGSEKKVYVLTGPTQHGVLIFGNDYLLTFDNDNKLNTKKTLHKNIIPVYFGGKEEEGKEVIGTMHNHLPETGDFITATDICTLMLYEKFTPWKQHNVVSARYLNIWNCLTDQLTVVPLDGKIKKEEKKKD
jgi:hypothetical protein